MTEQHGSSKSKKRISSSKKRTSTSSSSRKKHPKRKSRPDPPPTQEFRVVQDLISVPTPTPTTVAPPSIDQDDYSISVEDEESNGYGHFDGSNGNGYTSKRGSKYGLMSRKSSMLSSNDDPFAYREGKPLLWRNINMTLKTKNDEADIKLLDNVWGEVPARQTTAIMGPSGAGKTSLLNILAGRAASRGKVSIDSEIRLDNYIVDPRKIEVRRHIAFVAQDDSLQIASTPRESIYFSAKLRLPRDTPEKTLIKLTNKMLKELGLEKCADTYVGGALLKGISGGERKRTSIGVELVVKPEMVFLDEPTSGLDSFSALQLCQVLKKVASAGSSVLFTIHQPASEIFSSFDSLILLNKGRVMYQGAVDDVSQFFAKRGNPLPPKFNPADWIMSVAQTIPLDELDRKGYFPQDTRELEDAGTEIFIEGKDGEGIHDNEYGDVETRTASISTQIKLLYSRELKNISRDKKSVGARFFLTTFMSTLIGIIFLDVGETDSSIPANLQSHFGSLVMVVLMSMFGTAQPSLLAFPEERPVFLREYSTNHYSVVSYFLARLSMEASVTALQVLVLCTIDYHLISFQAEFAIFYLAVYCLAMSSTALAVMLGCSVEDPKLGQEMLPILFVPQMLFAGFFVVPELIPVWLRWARYLCSLTYAIRILLIEEFIRPGCIGGEEADEACETLVEAVGATEEDVGWNWAVLIILFVVFRLLALLILQRKALKFY